MSNFVKALFVSLSLFFVVLLSATPIQAQNNQSKPGPSPDRFELYGGYGYLHPIDSGVAGHQYPSIENLNATVSVSYFFARHFGAEVQGSYFSDNTTHRSFQICSPDFQGMQKCQQDQNMESVMAGVVYRLPKGRWVPYAHVLAGEQNQDGPVVNPGTTGFAVLGGVGLDYVLPFLGNHLAIRPIEADLQYGKLHYGPLVLPAGLSGGSPSITDVKLSAGMVLRLGSMAPKVPVTFSCVATPAEAFPGDPVTLQGTAMGLRMKEKTAYTWTASSGKIVPGPEGSNLATLDTAGLAAGEYKIAGHVSQGHKQYEQADCSASVTVRAYERPTISCSASPTEVLSGAESTVAAMAMSPQNRKLTYAYTSSIGVIHGSEASAQLTTSGEHPGTAEIGCTVMDDLGQTATATTSVTITGTAMMPEKPVSQSLCSISFERDQRRPARVDNEAKACLDDIALSLNRNADASLVILGSSADGEKSNVAAERAINARKYLVEEKGVDGQRIQVRTLSSGKRGADTILLPAGAMLNQPDSMEVDESTVKQHGEAYGKPRQKRQ